MSLIYNLYIEAFCSSQDTKVLSLLEFPSPLFFPGHSPRKFTVKRNGKRESVRKSSISQMIDYCSRRKQNEVSISYQPNSSRQSDQKIVLEDVTKTLVISPTNSLWTKTEDWPDTKNIRVSRERASLGSFEKYLAARQVDCYPTVLIFSASIRFENAFEDTKRQIFEILSESFSPELGISIFGGGGIDIFDAETKNFRYITPRVDGILTQNPQLSANLGKCFVTMQPYMFGNYSLCEAIYNSPETSAQIKKISLLGDEATLGLLVFPDTVLQQLSGQPSKTPWLC